MEGGREEGREERMKEEGRDGGREGGREGGRKGGMERERGEGRERGRKQGYSAEETHMPTSNAVGVTTHKASCSMYCGSITTLRTGLEESRTALHTKQPSNHQPLALDWWLRYYFVVCADNPLVSKYPYLHVCLSVA